MIPAGLSAVFAMLAALFVEGIHHMYPTWETWRKLRRVHGRRAIRAMRERFEENSRSNTPRILAEVLASLVVIWIALAGALDKRWYEVALDVLPYAFVTGALLRTPAALRAVAERMKGYERRSGEDPDEDLGDDAGGPQALAL